MSERDSIYDIVRTTDVQGYLTDEDSLNIADAILAAGYRRIPDDCVVVDVETAKIAFDALLHRGQDVRDPIVRHRYKQARLTIGELIGLNAAALSATRHGEVK